MRAALVNIYSALFAINRRPTASLRQLYERVGSVESTPRTLRYGRHRKKAYCLAAEAAPGTLEAILLYLQQQPASATVLDYGCGQAKSAPYRALGFTVDACDILPIETERFTKIDPATTTAPYADASFDIVIAAEVLEHVESPFALLAELVRVSKDKIIISTPNPQNLYSRSLFARTGFLHWFTPADFAYHCSPIFLWQLERFAREHQLRITHRQGNHEVFGLRGPLETHAESMIIVLQK